VSTKLLLLADTHVPKRARTLADQVWRAVDGADVVFHAGDWVTIDLLHELESRTRVIGVWGNNDGGELRERLPEIARETVDGIRFGVVHETGPSTGREARCDATFSGLDVLVFGHSHIPWDTITPLGMRLLNPGSPTDRRRQPHRTYLTAIADSGVLRDVTLVTVD
jgi:putative phosphoesterase